MFLKQLNLINFNNYDSANLRFSEKFNCITGKNGSGKTSLLDAIYYLSFCKSAFNPIDSQHINNNHSFFVIEGEYESNQETLAIFCGLKRNEKKQFKRNKKEYSRLSDHIGLIPLVMISPDDSELITEGSETRRKFLDGIISQYDKVYLEELLKYNRALAQRNQLLKSFYENRYFDPVALEIYNEQLIEAGNYIFKKRNEFFGQFNPLFNEKYHALAGFDENVSITYCSGLKEKSLDKCLTENLDRDKSAQYTTQGIHKDDLEFLINDGPIKKFGSQGQRKTMLLSLKLAQLELISSIKDCRPMLLLDDIYDKLDESRMMNLLRLVNTEKVGQVFITDTHTARIPELLSALNVPVKTFLAQRGQIEEMVTIHNPQRSNDII
jgi:DNA replication and repair protein RecF